MSEEVKNKEPPEDVTEILAALWHKHGDLITLQVNHPQDFAKLVKRKGIDPDTVSKALLNRAENLWRERWRESQKAWNADPKNTLKVVVPGDPELGGLGYEGKFDPVCRKDDYNTASRPGTFSESREEEPTQEKVMQLSRSAVVSLLVNLGYKGADKYQGDDFSDKLKKLPTSFTEDDEEVQDLDYDDRLVFDQIVEGVRAGEKINVVDDNPVSEGKTKPAAKAEKVKTKSVPAKDADPDDEEDSDEDEEEVKVKKSDKAATAKKVTKPTAKPAAKPAAKAEKSAPTKKADAKPSKNGKPEAKKQRSASKDTESNKYSLGDGEPGSGVLGTIRTALIKATSKAPVTAAAVLARLVKKFPDRSEESMKKTVSRQFAGMHVRGIIKTDGKHGYWAAKS